MQNFRALGAPLPNPQTTPPPPIANFWSRAFTKPICRTNYARYQISRLVHGNGIHMGIPWDGMGQHTLHFP